MSSIGIVILAAGDGKRMKTGIPKVMNLFKGEPLVSHVVRSAEGASFGAKPIVVVSPRHTLVQDYLGDRALYVVQPEQLGTGHAVGVAEALWSSFEHVVVLYGDMPFISSASIARLVSAHQAGNNSMTFMTTTVPHFEGSYAYFADFGRIIQDSSGRLVKNVQKKDATLEEAAVTELDTSYMCFNTMWLKTHLSQLQTNNVQKEYYLTDLLAVALSEGAKVGTVTIVPGEAIGINTKEHLDLAQTII
jgi:bifunctional UDP-N-acetylglucosamine pyrophosphorylase/glucosamine-1-phosphate N-acetyltransferase